MAGYLGQDSMRDKAMRVLMMEDKGPRVTNSIPVSPLGDKSVRHYANGGHVHKLTREQSDMHLPRRLLPRHTSHGDIIKPLNVESMREMEHMAHGGHHGHHNHHHHKMVSGGMLSEGGEVEHKRHGGSKHPNNLPYHKVHVAHCLAKGDKLEHMKHHNKCGNVKMKYASGGNVADIPFGPAVKRNSMLSGDIPFGPAVRIGSASHEDIPFGPAVKMDSTPRKVNNMKLGGHTFKSHMGHLGEAHLGMHNRSSSGRLYPHRKHKHYAEGTYAMGFGAPQQMGMAKGGHTPFPEGSTVYEKDMMGMHPSHKPFHINYEKDERGVHPIVHRSKKSGGRCYAFGGNVNPSDGQIEQQADGGWNREDEGPRPFRSPTSGAMLKRGGRCNYAMGGIGKLRHGEMTREGVPMNLHDVGLRGNKLPHLGRRSIRQRGE